MKIKIKDFKRLVEESVEELNEARSIPSVKITIEDDNSKKMISPEDGRVLSDDVSSWDRRKFLKTFKEFGIEFVEVVYNTFSKRKMKEQNWVKPGHYRARKFLEKVSQIEGDYPEEDIPIIKGEPIQHRTPNTLSTQRHNPHQIPQENFTARVISRILNNY